MDRELDREIHEVLATALKRSKMHQKMTDLGNAALSILKDARRNEKMSPNFSPVRDGETANVLRREGRSGGFHSTQGVPRPQKRAAFVLAMRSLQWDSTLWDSTASQILPVVFDTKALVQGRLGDTMLPPIQDPDTWACLIVDQIGRPYPSTDRFARGLSEQEFRRLNIISGSTRKSADNAFNKGLALIQFLENWDLDALLSFEGAYERIKEQGDEILIALKALGVPDSFKGLAEWENSKRGFSSNPPDVLFLASFVIAMRTILFDKNSHAISRDVFATQGLVQRRLNHPNAQDLKEDHWIYLILDEMGEHRPVTDEKGNVRMNEANRIRIPQLIEGLSGRNATLNNVLKMMVEDIRQPPPRTARASRRPKDDFDDPFDRASRMDRY